MHPTHDAGEEEKGASSGRENADAIPNTDAVSNADTLADTETILAWIGGATFPGGGGGYKVATQLLGTRAGLVSGAALMVDYVDRKSVV